MPSQRSPPGADFLLWSCSQRHLPGLCSSDLLFILHTWPRSCIMKIPISRSSKPRATLPDASRILQCRPIHRLFRLRARLRCRQTCSIHSTGTSGAVPLYCTPLTRQKVPGFIPAIIDSIARLVLRRRAAGHRSWLHRQEMQHSQLGRRDGLGGSTDIRRLRGKFCFFYYALNAFGLRKTKSPFRTRFITIILLSSLPLQTRRSHQYNLHVLLHSQIPQLSSK